MVVGISWTISMASSSDNFTNISTLRIYVFGCCYEYIVRDIKPPNNQSCIPQFFFYEKIFHLIWCYWVTENLRTVGDFFKFCGLFRTSKLYMIMNKQISRKKIRRFVAYKFVKVSDELINILQNWRFQEDGKEEGCVDQFLFHWILLIWRAGLIEKYGNDIHS